MAKIPEQLIAEFDGKRHDKLRSWEGVLPHREISSHDYLYVQIYSGEELLDEKWIQISGNKNLTINFSKALAIEWYDLLVEDLGYSAGNYRIEYCVKRKAVWPNEYVRVNEISKNKMEIRVDAINEDALVNVRSPLIGGEYYAPLDIFHEKVGISKGVNWFYDEHHKDETLIIKLSDKIERDIKVGDEIELWDEIVSTKELELILEIDLPKGLEPYTELRGPMITLDVNSEVGKPTELQSWDAILTGSSDVNESLTATVLSSSTGAELNIDYRKFENFIHFSSAKERMTNFEYKMSLIEYYASKSFEHSSGLSGEPSSSVTASSIYVSQSSNYSTQKENIIGSFDGFENHLYNTSGSGTTENSITYYSTTWPKYANPAGTTAYPKYINYSVTSSEAQSWLTGSYDSGSRYDEDNVNLLRKTIPAMHRSNSSNSGFVLFVDMIAQHFDILYNYIDSLKSQRNKDEALNIGISKDLLFDSLKAFGWQPKSGLDLENIWQYWLGTTRTGGYAGPGTTAWDADSLGQYPSTATTSSAWSTEPFPKRDLEFEPLSRIMNNLPYLLKTKGTTRGLRALISCYGIPSSFFKIQEFGGPDPNRHSNATGSHLRELDIQNHSLQFQGGTYANASSHNFISGAWGGDDVQSVELRIKTNYQNSQSIFSTCQNPLPAAASRQQLFLIPSKSAGDPDTDYAYLKYCFSSNNSSTYSSASLGKLPILDNDWWTIALTNNAAGTVTVTCQKSPDHAGGAITHKDTTQLSYVHADNGHGWSSTAVDIMMLGQAENVTNTEFNASASNLDPFSGSMQEFRMWSCELDADAIDWHTKAPTSIYGLSYSSSYSDLLLRLPFGTDNNIDHHTASVNTFTSTHTDQSKTGFMTSTYYMTGHFEWEPEEETYFIQTPNSFGLRSISNKIRIEDNTVNGTLEPFDSQESSSSDTNPIDLPDLYVSVSPQDDIDIDVGLQFGEFKLDDYVGDPREARLTEYANLRNLRNDYYKKFSGPQKLQAYINTLRYVNTALFQQIDSMLPARGTNVVGLMIKPTLLERSKVAYEPSFSFQQVQRLGKTNHDQQNLEHYTQSIDCFSYDNLQYTDDYDAMQYTFDNDGSYAKQWFSTLTDTIRTDIGHSPNRYSINIAGFHSSSGVARDTNLDGSQLTMSIAGTMPFAYDQPTPKDYSKIRYYYSSSLSASLHKWYSSSYEPVQIVQQDIFAGLYNSFVGGCKMTSLDFNVDSSDTIDGGPVVEYIEGNPNTLISTNPGLSGDLLVR